MFRPASARPWRLTGSSIRIIRMRRRGPERPKRQISPQPTTVRAETYQIQQHRLRATPFAQSLKALS